MAKRKSRAIDRPLETGGVGTASVAVLLLAASLSIALGMMKHPPTLLLNQGLRDDGFKCTQLEIGPSKIVGAGNGVITGKRIRKGAPVMFYEGVEHVRTMQADDFRYALSLASGNAYIGFVPNRTECGVAQLVNDAGALFIKLPVSFPSLATQVAEYARASLHGVNVKSGKQEPLVMYAIRDIEPGEELYLSCTYAPGSPTLSLTAGMRVSRPDPSCLMCSLPDD